MTQHSPISAVSIALVDGQRVLLVRRGRPPAMGFYAFPGGRVEPGESLEEAIRRELVEETSLRVGAVTQVETLLIEREKEGPDFELHVFRGDYLGGAASAGDDADLVGWFTLDEMTRMPVIPSVLAVARRLISRT